MELTHIYSFDSNSHVESLIKAYKASNCKNKPIKKLSGSHNLSKVGNILFFCVLLINNIIAFINSVLIDITIFVCIHISNKLV